MASSSEDTKRKAFSVFQGRLLNLSCSTVPTFVLSITATTQVSGKQGRGVKGLAHWTRPEARQVPLQSRVWRKAILGLPNSHATSICTGT